MKWWPPFLGAGIKVAHVSDDMTSIKVSMPLRFYNANIVNVHFGGSLYSMCDPFFMCILMIQLGNDYIVWDKSAEIKFVKPGRSRVHATFEISQAEVANIKIQVADGKKYEPVYRCNVYDDKDELIATIRKTLYIRKKPGK